MRPPVSKTLMLHKKHAKVVIKTIKPMSSLKFAPVYGKNKG